MGNDEFEEHFLDANERLGEALTEIGMALGLPKPRPGATWGAPEILVAVARLRAIEEAAGQWIVAEECMPEYAAGAERHLIELVKDGAP